MRLPVVSQISTKDGISNKNSRLTNMLKESRKTGDLAVVRPGLVLSDTYTGIGGGLIPFDGRLLQIWDDTVYDPNDYGTWPLDAPQWDAGTTYNFGDSVWLNGDLWFSLVGSNMGHSPVTGAYWGRQPTDSNYDPTHAYGVGDTVSVSGTTYYSLAGANIGHDPSANQMLWSLSAPPSTRFYGTGSGFDGAPQGAPYTTASCATMDACATTWWNMLTFKTCAAARAGGAYNWLTYDYTLPSPPGVGGTGLANFRQWAALTPYNCTNNSMGSLTPTCTIHRTA